MTVRSSLYRLARILGDIQAAKRGPQAMARRYLRKRALRAVGGKINKL